MTSSEADMPTPAWRLKEIVGRWAIFEYATFRTNEELRIFSYEDGTYRAVLSGTEGKEVTDRLSQERWAEICQKARAASVLLGRKPEIIEEIF